MATTYDIRYVCIACGNRRRVESRYQVYDTTHRKCPKCREEREKVSYIAEMPKMKMQK